jgi:hypothetical protein
MSDPETWTISGPSAANAKLVSLHIGQARRRPDRAAYTNGGKGSNEYVSIYLNISSPAQIRPGRPISSSEALLLDVTARWRQRLQLEATLYIYTPPDAKARWRQRRSLFRLKFKYYLLQFHAGFWPNLAPGQARQMLEKTIKINEHRQSTM